MPLKELMSNPYRRFCASWWKWLVVGPWRLFTVWIPYRIKHGFWSIETWNLGWEATKWMLPRLKQFRAELIGYPVVLNEGETFEEWENLSSEEREKRWTSIIDEAVEAFQCVIDAENDYPGFEEEQAAYERATRAWENLGKNMFGLWN